MKRTGQGKIAVVGWGRGMGHKGHMYLASSVITQAQRMGADPYFFVSKTVGKDDPIFPEEKIEIYQKVFPQHATIFQAEGNLNQALTDLAQAGYQGVVVVVGADQKQAFQYLERPNKEGVPVYQSMGLKKLRVISRQETGDESASLEGPRATPMREILLHPQATEEQKFKVWRDAMPDALNDQKVLELMRKAEARLMGSVKKKKIKEFVERVKPMLSHATTEQKQKIIGLLENELKEFAPDEGGGSRKFIPWTEFIEQLKQILHKDFSCKENIVKSTIKARFIPHDPMEYGPTMLYSYYETRAGGRNKGAVSTRGSIQVGKYTKGGLFGHAPDQLLTGFHLLKGHPFERHFDLTFDNIYKIANIIQGNTEGALEFKPEQQVNEFASSGDGDNGQEDMFFKYAKLWYNGNEQVQQRIIDILHKAGWEIGEIESEEGGAFIVQSGDENGNSYMSWSAEDLSGLDESLKKKLAAAALGAGMAASAPGAAVSVAGAIPTPSHQQAMYKAVADSNRAEAKRQAELKAKADAERLQKNTEIVDKEQRVNHHKLDEFAPGNGDDDGEDYDLEFQVYQCNPDNEFEFIGGPLQQFNDLGRAHDFAYKLHMKNPNKAFMIWQPSVEHSRGGYGISSDDEPDDMNEDYLEE